MNDARRKPRPQTEDEVLHYFDPQELDSGIREYLRFHAKRYAFLLDEVDRREHGRILDIGPSFQTTMMRESYPDSAVDTLGFLDVRFPRRENDRHIDFDLNDCLNQECWPVLETPYDMVVMAEVLEHVYTAARPVLTFVASLLRPGGTLILQTPNAVNLGRRLSTLRGQNPFGMIREEKKNPGHFCEFTVEDLKLAAESANLLVQETTVTNYFGSPGYRKTIYEMLCTLLPGELRDGITLIARKP
jgi:2-polyprenyl-3-methyl-5-hydroxy-6-metoxy-1,4-benzoquinol methylase